MDYLQVMWLSCDPHLNLHLTQHGIQIMWLSCDPHLIIHLSLHGIQIMWQSCDPHLIIHLSLHWIPANHVTVMWPSPDHTPALEAGGRAACSGEELPSASPLGTSELSGRSDTQTAQWRKASDCQEPWRRKKSSTRRMKKQIQSIRCTSAVSIWINIRKVVSPSLLKLSTLLS